MSLRPLQFSCRLATVTALQSDRVRFLFSGRGASRQDDRWRIWAHSTAKKSSAKLSSDVEALQFCRPLLLLLFFFWLSRASRGSAPTPKTTPSEPNRSPLSTRPLPSLSPRLIPPPSLLPLRRPTLSLCLSLPPSLHAVPVRIPYCVAAGPTPDRLVFAPFSSPQPYAVPSRVHTVIRLPGGLVRLSSGKPSILRSVPPEETSTVQSNNSSR